MSPKEYLRRVFNPTPEERRKQYEFDKAQYNREVEEYEKDQRENGPKRSMNVLWHEGYGFNNPNTIERWRNGTTEDLFKNLPPPVKRPTPPTPPGGHPDAESQLNLEVPSSSY